jgi:hypothetical protein
VSERKKEYVMRAKILTSAAAIAFVIAFAAYALSDTAKGAAAGAFGGAVVGGIAEENKAKFREYVAKKNLPSYAYTGEVAIGADLPLSGIPLYEIPSEYGATMYRFTIINYGVVLVDPFSHRIVDIIY